ncbi:nucleoside phosphorylase [Paenibacillus sp. N1-5-1-14]|uniref:nucleoside phosphorylase n=1 Tax=Paenibacillus radicibacter TaxID=2972488 RepID=UPI0021592A52|nr:nucleoside phosphorylase [Paenibacillus radicibacter]MCR8645982.1 nucleoside phosphorylase [Paenibacillus radicibacter]
MEKQPHIQLDEALAVNKAIVVGDPARVEVVKSLLDNPQDITYNREFKSAIGTFNGHKILVLSTGIGAPSMAIAIEELKAIGIESVIRAGSCGAMDTTFKVGEIMVVTGAVRDEGLTEKYVPKAFPAVPSSTLLMRALQQTAIPVKAGIARSHDGFYMDNNMEIEDFWSHKQVLGADMETSALYVIGGLRGLQTLSILNNVVPYKESLADGVNELVSGESQMKVGELQSIKLALAVLTEEE